MTFFSTTCENNEGTVLFQQVLVLFQWLNAVPLFPLLASLRTWLQNPTLQNNGSTTENAAELRRKRINGCRDGKAITADESAVGQTDIKKRDKDCSLQTQVHTYTVLLLRAKHFAQRRLDMGRSTFFKISWYTIRSCVISRYSRYSRSEIPGLFQLASVATSHVTLPSTKD